MKSFIIIPTFVSLAFGAAINGFHARDVADEASQLQTLKNLVQNGEIEFVSTDKSARAVAKRANVPFLQCDFGTAGNCALASSGTVAACFFAAIQEGRDIKSDTTCAAAITAEGANLPASCKTCLGE